MASNAAVAGICESQQGCPQATILAIGTDVPPNCVHQNDYPDFYFRVTKSEHMTNLKEKFKRMCDRSMIKKRYMYLTEEILQEQPSMCNHMEASLNVRQDMLVSEVVKLGKEAATKAIEEWGGSKSQISHLIMCTTSCIDMPGIDFKLTKLLSLNMSVIRTMIYFQGCSGGGAVLRLAKDIAENNRGSRVLIVCSEITAIFFRGPIETRWDSLVGPAIFGDGAAALIVGAEPHPLTEHPLFEIVRATQTIIPNSDHTLEGHLREEGLTFHLSKALPSFISNNIGEALHDAFSPFGISDWSSLFWITHPGGPVILNQIANNLGLRDDKLAATRKVLRDYGNMSSASVLFIMDEMRKKSLEEGKATTGEGLEWGVLFGFGPGLTIETVVLKSFPLRK